MSKTILYIALCAAALASGALFAQPGIGVGANATGGANLNTPATPATPAIPATPATPAAPAAPEAAVDSKIKVDFDQVDANADGKISRDEAKGDLTLSSRFQKLDKNRDRNLSLDEYKEAAAPSKPKPQG